MSVRAYKIITKEYKNEPSFNLWHHQSLTDYLESIGDFSQTLDEGGGQISVSVKAIEQALKDEKLWTQDDLKDDAEMIKQALKDDIKEFVGDDCAWIDYECF